MYIKIKDKEGNLYSTPTAQDENCILSIHFCTSYVQFEVQKVRNKEGVMLFHTKDVIVLNKNNNPIDLIAISNDDIGEIVECIL